MSALESFNTNFMFLFSIDIEDNRQSYTTDEFIRTFSVSKVVCKKRFSSIGNREIQREMTLLSLAQTAFIILAVVLLVVIQTSKDQNLFERLNHKVWCITSVEAVQAYGFTTISYSLNKVILLGARFPFAILTISHVLCLVGGWLVVAVWGT